MSGGLFAFPAQRAPQRGRAMSALHTTQAIATWGAGIDADMLERMARIARDLPGHTVSLDSEVARPPDSEPVLRIDGVAADEVLACCFDDFD
jgi:hypothetical protein